jgi:hypothetical protein
VVNTWRYRPGPWATSGLGEMVRTQRREGQSARLRYRLLLWWNLTLAASNVAHYLGGAGVGYGLALLVHLGCGVYAAAQLGRTRRGAPWS